MTANINFLLHKDGELLRRQKTARFLNFIAFAFLLGIAIVSLVIFLLAQAINLAPLREEQDQIQKKISAFQNKRIKIFALNNRLAGIQEIFDKREKALRIKQNLARITDNLLAKVSDNLTVEKLEIDDKIVALTVKSTSLFYIGELINNLADMVRNKEIINSLTLESLTHSDNENYFQVSIKAQL